MLLSDVERRQAYVAEIRRKLTGVMNILSSIYGGASVVDEVMTMRGYTSPRMREYLLSKNIVKMPALSDITYLASGYGIKLDQQTLIHMGLTSAQGDYWLQDRYAIPLKTWLGTIQALVCWYPDKRKYITTSTLGFTTVSTFFNMESYPAAYQFPDGLSRVFVVEGIFDALSIASLGYCALGNQGLDLGGLKKEMLSRFDIVYFIPDNDAPGNKSNKYLCGNSNHLWDIPNGKLIKLEGRAKDMDDVLKGYELTDLSSFMTDSCLLRVNT